MAGSSDQPAVHVTFDRDSQLGEAWEEWANRYDSDAAAARQAIRRGIAGDADEPAIHAGPLSSLAITAMMAAAVASLVAQAAVVFDMVVASGLTALALVIVGGVMFVYGD